MPNAPTNVSATPSGTNITVSWTDNSTDDTSFNIQQGTVNSDGSITWIAIASVSDTIGTIGGQDTYTDSTALNDGTAYLYQVNASATGTNGGSDYVETPCAVAIPIAYDGFNYASVNGTNPWNGGNTGIGFASGWSLNNTAGTTLVSGSLTYSKTDGKEPTYSPPPAIPSRSETAVPIQPLSKPSAPRWAPRIQPLGRLGIQRLQECIRHGPTSQRRSRHRLLHE